ncbi:protein madd-4 isoform X6 [Contarinia nasturtii]|uniref:protein madd-4 isoform X6 n=1 Tax=Contarinia nasturtii TaxID=265458 RepID=UPI0012D38220|nr:protein madd-4 isoform X6 [Contarinia nasturtii]
MKMILQKNSSFLLGILLCVFSTIASQERHTREHQHHYQQHREHQHQHQHHRHHNVHKQQQQQQQQQNLINPENVHSNKTFGGHAWLSHPDATENELEKRGKNGWGPWAAYSSCSRSCDGGIQQQIRRCHSTHCRGEPIRYRICNMQPCPEAQDFRAHQCAAFDETPYDGSLFKWTPHYIESEPCALTCRGKPVNLASNGESETDIATEIDQEPSVIVQLSSRVNDGTRCRIGSLDMCINGRCMRVGCDLRIGSSKKVDACGVCGGNGSTCSQPMYQWDMAPMSLCSATCGGGYKMSRPLCRNRMTSQEVEESLCNSAMRPEPAVVQCNTHSCPPKWITDEWSSCSKTCGRGTKERNVVCIEESNGLKNKLPDDACRDTSKPPTFEPCNIQFCPKWITREWSGADYKNESDEQVMADEEGKQYHRPAHLTRSHLHHDEPSPVAERFTDKRSKTEYQMPSEATFIKDTNWSVCSVTCGEGIRTKQYRCKIFLELSQTLATLHNDSFCLGPKPAPEVEACSAPEPCFGAMASFGYEDNYPRDSIKVGVSEPGKTYIWKEQGYTSCSASCLGGVEELIINCVREDTGKVVSPFLCSPETKPEARIRTCNDRPCPPRWNYSDFSPCSKSCGIGIRERGVQCIHEVTRGGENTMVVPDSMCPQPPPAPRQYCNILDCPVRWEVSAWSKCSKPCGGGFKERKVECKQIMAKEHKVERLDVLCPNMKPAHQKPCNTKPCAPEDENPSIAASNTTYIQHDPKKTKVTLKIGGAATVFLGTQIKIKCPVKSRFNRTKIRWSKDSKFLTKTRNVKLSKKGALRILNVTYRDKGVYACHASMSVSELRLSVKPKPGDREATSADYESIEEEEEEAEEDDDNIIDGEDEDRTVAYQVPAKNINGSRLNQLNKDQNHQKDFNNIRRTDKKLTQNEELNDDSPLSAASSSGTRTVPMPHFQHLLASLQFLWPFQSFSNSKGRNYLVEHGMKIGIDLDSVENDDPVVGFNQLSLGQGVENVTVLGNGPRDSVKFEWMVTPWTECSQNCGPEIGYKFRRTQCMVRLHNTTQNVDSVLCKDAGLSEPETFEKCGGEECAQWVAGEWTLCLQSRCQRRHKAIQDRNVLCLFPNNTESDLCDPNEKPITRQECDNQRCIPVWRMDEWTDCKATCGQGVKYRTVKCVWYGSNRRAINGCRDTPMPAMKKECKGPPCAENYAQCKDSSRYCTTVLSMGLCKLHRYQQKCCKSCRSKNKF